MCETEHSTSLGDLNVTENTVEMPEIVRDTNRGETSNFLAQKSEKGHLAFTEVITKYLDAKELGAEALKNLRRNKRKRGEETGNRGCKEWTRK